MKTHILLLAVPVMLIASANARAQDTPVTVSAVVVAASTDSTALRTAVASSTEDIAVAPAAVESSNEGIAVSHTAVKSSIDAGPAAMRRTATDAPSVGYTMAATNKGLGQAKALMGVGIAGFVAGALIGGDGGRVIMVGSAVVGLYGLYLYLQ
jgi:hypothetical protein